MPEPVRKLGVGTEARRYHDQPNTIESDNQSQTNLQQQQISTVLSQPLLVPLEYEQHKADGSTLCAAVQTVGHPGDIGLGVLQLGHEAAEEEEGTDNGEGEGENTRDLEGCR
jgi:hypothetical protein